MIVLEVWTNLLRASVKIAGLTFLVSGLALIAFYAVQTFEGYSSEDAAQTPGGAPTTAQGIAPEGSEDESAEGPDDKSLSLTVPKVDIEDANIPTSEPSEAALRDNLAVRLPGTGLPWREETNVYIAGHELGYPFTDSFRAFYDLKTMEEGDEIRLTDAEGTEYTYEVFEVVVVQPEELWVLDPIEDKNIVSLQVSETQQEQDGVTPKRVVRAELIEES